MDAAVKVENTAVRNWFHVYAAISLDMPGQALLVHRLSPRPRGRQVERLPVRLHDGRLGSQNGPGHHSFVRLNGDIATSPPAGPRFPLMFHAAPEGTPYSWANRYWHTGTFCWWGNTTYHRANVPGPTADTGFSIKFLE